VGVYAATGHGEPSRVSDGLTGAQIRAAGLDFSSSLYFSGPCWCGVPKRWFRLEKGSIAEHEVAPTESFLLGLVSARASGVFAGLDPDRGESSHHELEHLLLHGEPLGHASKSTYDDAVLAYRREKLALPRYEEHRGYPYRDIHDLRISGGACRALFGDPAWAPFKATGADPFRVTTKRGKEGLAVTWRGDDSLGRYWGPVDVMRPGSDADWTHRVRFRIEVPREEAAKLRKFEVVSMTKDGKPLAYVYPTAALESWGDRVRVHGMLVFPPDPKNQALWGGKEWEAKFLFRE
jgi:hypothetical protein